MVSGETFSRNSSNMFGTQFLSVSLISFLHSELHPRSLLQRSSRDSKVSIHNPKTGSIVSEPSFSHCIVGEIRGVSCPGSRIHPLKSSLNDSVQPGSWGVSIGFHQAAPIHDKWVNSPKDIRIVLVRIREMEAWGTFKEYLHIHYNISCIHKYSQEWIQEFYAFQPPLLNSFKFQFSFMGTALQQTLNVSSHVFNHPLIRLRNVPLRSYFSTCPSTYSCSLVIFGH